MLFLSCNNAADSIFEIRMVELSVENLICNDLLSVFLQEKHKQMQMIVEANFNVLLNI